MSGFTIIIPTYEAWALLERTLVALTVDLRAQSRPWEILLIDNESSSRWVIALRELLDREPAVRLIRRTGLSGRHFQPGAARNIGIDAAAYDQLIFLDADCIPAPGFFTAYAAAMASAQDAVLVGHRIFVDARNHSPAQIAKDRELLSALPHVPSTSNYGVAADRRLPDLLALDEHRHPYECLHGCNFALNRAALGQARFDPLFDGHWGYEDIELGYRLHRSGRPFVYVPGAFVYHQENPDGDLAAREQARHRNFEIAGRLIPGFLEQRQASRRISAVPKSINLGAEVR